MYIKFLFSFIICLSVCTHSTAQKKRKTKAKDTITVVKPPIVPPKPASNPNAPKPFKDVITSKAVSDTGLFIVHKVDDKYLFEVPDSVIGRDILVVNRISKAAAGMRNSFMGYAGDQIGNNVIQFEKGPNNKVFLKKVSFDEFSSDSTQPMFHSVKNSNVLPIVSSFDIKSDRTDSNGVVIDFTSFVSGDNDILFFGGTAKNAFQIGSYQADKSYIDTITSYPYNTEIKTVKTYTKGTGAGLSAMPATNRPSSPQNILFTLSLNSSMVLLPKKPVQKRFFDPRVGYFARRYTDFDANPQGIKETSIIVRWHLEPRDEDKENYKQGKLVEPQKPIVFYIDPATPAKWVPYLIQGVNDWQVAFEQAGFKNAILGKLAPTKEEDPEWSLEDARYSAIVYKPSTIPNASGPNVHDPRSGQILESHINWYHNVMSLLRNWYFIQASPNDPRATKMTFDDELMGQLIRFVSAHEVGHTLGLRHNFGSSSTIPVDSLRNKAWVEANGHTPSIMDYARFNYVAQPEDKISPEGLFPKIGVYDKWAIQWGYTWYPDLTPEQEIPVLNKLTIEKLKDKKHWFGTESNPDDPRSQNEDLGDNAMKAGTYGIKNLQRIVPNLLEWTRTPNEGYENLNTLYSEVSTQLGRYLGHAAKNIGGIYETPKTSDQAGAVYSYTPAAVQKEAMRFLQKEVFTTPKWLIPNNILDQTGQTGMSVISTRQDAVLARIISTSTISKLLNMEAAIGKEAYTAAAMLQELKNGIWSELRTNSSIDIYRRNLQKAYIQRCGFIIQPPSTSGISFRMGAPAAMADIQKSDIISVLKGNLRSIQAEVKAALPGISDNMTRYHLQDVQDRIEQILNPGK